MATGVDVNKVDAVDAVLKKHLAAVLLDLSSRIDSAAAVAASLGKPTCAEWINAALADLQLAKEQL